VEGIFSFPFILKIFVLASFHYFSCMSDLNIGFITLSDKKNLGSLLMPLIFYICLSKCVMKRILLFQLLLLFLTGCNKHSTTPKRNSYSTAAVIEFNFGSLSFKRSLDILPSGDSISKTIMLVTPELYDSIMQGISTSENLDRHRHYMTVLFLDSDLYKSSIIGYDNILGFGIYSIKRTKMHYKLFVKNDGIFTPVDNYTCSANRIYCNDNSAIARHFISIHKRPVTWLSLCDRKKDPIITSRHELSSRLNFPIN